MFILILGVIISVAYLTLLERKLLGYIQNRKGPNKLGFIGLFQPFSDAVKLFSKEKLFILNLNLLIYILTPILLFLTSLLLWLIFSFKDGFFFFHFRLLFIISVISLSVYYIIIIGWSSNRNYSFLGGIRGISQVISYEIRIVIFILVILTYIIRFNLLDFVNNQLNIWLIFNFILFFLILRSILAELNRTPFDFIEGESELVSGFNIEFGRFLFAFIFLGEYIIIIFISYIISLIFLSSKIFRFFIINKFIFFIFFIIWIRGRFPRYRYDKLINLNWKIYLPISINFLISLFSIKILLFLNKFSIIEIIMINHYRFKLEA